VKTCIALFRGINVGGKNLLPMKELVAVLEELGCRDVRTYIQSGNAVFTCAGREAPKLPERIRQAIKKLRGFEPQVLVLEPGEIEQAMKNNPFPEAVDEPQTLHVGFLATTPAAPDLEGLENLRIPSEQFRLIGQVFYLHAPAGIGNSRLAAGAEKRLGVPMTARNWKTVCRLRDMAG